MWWEKPGWHGAKFCHLATAGSWSICFSSLTLGFLFCPTGYMPTYLAGETMRSHMWATRPQGWSSLTVSPIPRPGEEGGPSKAGSWVAWRRRQNPARGSWRVEHSGLSCGRAQRLPGASASLRANAARLGCPRARAARKVFWAGGTGSSSLPVALLSRENSPRLRAALQGALGGAALACQGLRPVAMGLRGPSGAIGRVVPQSRLCGRCTCAGSLCLGGNEGLGG